jgi:diguanylate cyclase (GGDEF)-like protein/PAS domain S-box-containing protein
MKIAPLPADERERLAALRKYDILDTEPEAAFDSVVHLASYVCQAPIAAISLVDEGRQWFKAITGLDAKQTSRDVAFCAHTILQRETMIVADARADERFRDNPLVTSPPDIRFYAGVPLVTPQGFHLGTLCVIDRVPRVLTAEQLDAVKVLAGNVMAHLDLRLSHRQIRQYVGDLQLAATIFESSSESMIVTDAQNRIITVNPAFTAVTGYAMEEVVGRNPSLLSSGRQGREFYQAMWQALRTTGHWDGEVWNLRKNGTPYAEWLSINVLLNPDGTPRLHVGTFSDITTKKQADEVIWGQAHLDHLTRLPNRRLFVDRLEQSLKQAHRLRSSVGLLFIDLDHFKEVNDEQGHEVGDLLLRTAAERISRCVRQQDTVARIGGDEFTVILTSLPDPAVAGAVAEAILGALAEPFTARGVELRISASIGVAVSPADGEAPEELLRHADTAMYTSKSYGRSRVSHFTPLPTPAPTQGP